MVLGMQVEMGFQISTTKDASIDALLKRLYSSKHAVGKTGMAFDSVSVSTQNNLVTIERLMKAGSPLYTLEVGMCFGGSTVVFASMYQRLNPCPQRRRITINPHKVS